MNEHERNEGKYECIKIDDSLLSALCADVITDRTYNIGCHFSSNHENVREMPNEEKSEFIAKRVLDFGKQIKLLNRFVSCINHLTSASFVAALNIDTSGETLTDV